MSIIVDQIVVSDKFKHNNEGFKYFIGYQEDGLFYLKWKGYIKYFENESKNMSFLIKDDEVSDKFDKIWDGLKIN